MSLPLARRRPPELFTLFSKDVRIDVLVGAPRVAAVGRYVRAPFEPERERTRLDEGHFVHYFPARVRISFIAQPELVLDMQPREIRVEHTRELDSPPPERVRDVATEVVEAFADKHPNKHRAYVDYDPASHGVDVSWEAPAPRHMLTPARTTRGPGQMPPRPVRFRIHLLLREAANEAGLRAASAQDKANALAREWQLSSAQIRAIEEEFQGTGTVHRGEATRSLLTAEPEDAPAQLGGGASASRLGPKRDPRRARARSFGQRRRRDPQMTRQEALRIEEAAEAAKDPDAFRVAADAWLEAGEPERARFMLMHLWTTPPIITGRQYRAIQDKIARWEHLQNEFKERFGRWPEENELDESRRPTDLEFLEGHQYEFLRDPPLRTRLEIGADGKAYLEILGPPRVYVGEAKLGGRFRTYGGRGEPNRQAVSIQAANGYRYHGTCSEYGGCWVRRGRMWIVPQTGKRLR